MIGSLVSFWMLQLSHQRQAVGRTQALSIAEAGVEMGLWKLNNQPGYIGETDTVYGEGTFTVTVTNSSTTTRLIKAEAFVPNRTSPKSKRTVQVTAVVGTTNVGFNYGVQVGSGGLTMTNSSTVVGNVYSNGDIIGSNSARIQGTAIVAGSGQISGMDVDNNAQAYSINNTTNVGGNATVSVLDNSTVTGNVVADAISNCSVGGTANFDTRTSCAVSGTATSPNSNDYPTPPVVPLPITEEQIDTWEDDAADGGTMAGTTYLSGTRNLGPVKINGNLTITNTAEVVVTGTIWITGNLTIEQSGILRLHNGYSGLSGLIVVGQDESSANGVINIDNNTQILGSGTAGSYLMLLSQKEGWAAPAIVNNNSGVSAILYAGEGLIEIGNSAGMKEVTADKLSVSNSATVTYETGLASTQFSSGAGGGWEIMANTWQLLQ